MGFFSNLPPVIESAEIAENAVGTRELDQTSAFNLTSTSGTIGGVNFTNLLDKSAPETVSGAWNFTDANSSIGGVTGVNLLDKTAPETITGAWDLGPCTSTGAYNFAGSSGSVGGVLNTNLLDKTAPETVSGAWNFTDTSSTFGGVAGADILPKTGGTMTGDLTLAPPTGAPEVMLDMPTGVLSEIVGAADGVSFTVGGTYSLRVGNDVITVKRSLSPDPSGSYDIGSTAQKWKHAYLAGDINIDGFVDGVDVSTIHHDASGNALVPIAPYAGDETVVSTTSTAYETMKSFNVLRDSTNLPVPGTLVAEVEGKVTSTPSTMTAGIFIDGTEQMTGTITATSYTLIAGTYGVSGWGDGKHLVELKLKTSETGGTVSNRLWEVYLK